MAKQRVITLPAFESDFSQESPLTYWKQILPQATINYTTKSGKRSKLTFDENYLRDLATAFNEKALDSTPFLLADADNAHTMDPERWRADVVDMRLANPGEKPGLYAKLQFPNAESAKAVLANPKLGVSARIREGITTHDNRTFPAGIIHVLGTLDPQVTGMTGWQPVDLSAFGKTLNLSNEAFSEGNEMAKNNGKTPKPVAEVTEEDIDAMTEDELDAFLAEVAPDFMAEISGEEVEAEGEEVEEAESAGASLSNRRVKRDIELANTVAAQATARANEALRRAAAAEWKEYRTVSLSAGVPAFMLDMAEPVLNRADDMVIDLSNTDDEDINVSEIVRSYIDAAKGQVDLSNETGHYRSDPNGDGTDPDKEAMAIWEAQFPGSK